MNALTFIQILCSFNVIIGGIYIYNIYKKNSGCELIWCAIEHEHQMTILNEYKFIRIYDFKSIRPFIKYMLLIYFIKDGTLVQDLPLVTFSYCHYTHSSHFVNTVFALEVLVF